MKIFDKQYSAEELVDLQRDIYEGFDPDFNELMAKIPVDRHGFQKGTFRVTIEWSEE